MVLSQSDLKQVLKVSIHGYILILDHWDPGLEHDPYTENKSVLVHLK